MSDDRIRQLREAYNRTLDEMVALCHKADRRGRIWRWRRYRGCMTPNEIRAFDAKAAKLDMLRAEVDRLVEREQRKAEVQRALDLKTWHQA